MEDNKDRNNINVEINITEDDQLSEEEEKLYDYLSSRQSRFFSLFWLCVIAGILSVLIGFDLLGYALIAISLPFFLIAMYYFVRVQERYGWPWPF